MDLLHKLLPNLGQSSPEARHFIEQEKRHNAMERNSLVTEQGRQLRELRQMQFRRVEPQFELLMQGTPKCDTCIDYQKGFANKEGFDLIYGDNPIKQKNATESSTMTSLTTLMQQKLTAFKNAQKTLMDAVARFLGTEATRANRVNYNIYTSRGADVDKIPDKEEGCYTIPLNDSLQLQEDMGRGVSLMECKRRAADTGKSVFGVSAKYGECYTGTDIQTIKTSASDGLKMTSMYVLNEAPSVNVAKMMFNGQTGLYSANDATRIVPTAKYTGAPKCDMLIGGKIDVQTATFGGNCPEALQRS